MLVGRLEDDDIIASPIGNPSGIKHYDNFLRKMRLKKETASDMQVVLDAQSAENIQFSEWKRQLKRRGYTDEEIATMFARYDVDGSQSLDAMETNALKMDLASEKREAASEYGSKL
uniref:EF-hand domain-containing protein n=1 Tax=Romanomermis culicivorax TaxID=13658 RepID=A0A915IGK4_ROMCU